MWLSTPGSSNNSYTAYIDLSNSYGIQIVLSCLIRRYIGNKLRISLLIFNFPENRTADVDSQLHHNKLIGVCFSPRNFNVRAYNQSRLVQLV